MLELNKLAREANANAVRQGYWNLSQSPLFMTNACGLVVTECAELLEAYRRGTDQSPCDKPIDLSFEEEEMADIVLRVMDMAGGRGVDLERAILLKHQYNLERPTAKEQGKEC